MLSDICLIIEIVLGGRRVKIGGDELSAVVFWVHREFTEIGENSGC